MFNIEKFSFQQFFNDKDGSLRTGYILDCSGSSRLGRMNNSTKTNGLGSGCRNEQVTVHVQPIEDDKVPGA